MTITPPRIDPTSDQILSDSKAAKLLKVSPHAVWRYRTRGKQGVLLPAVPFGRGYVTTRECIAWWFAELQRVNEDRHAPRQNKRRQLDPVLEAELDRAGL